MEQIHTLNAEWSHGIATSTALFEGFPLAARSHGGLTAGAFAELSTLKSSALSTWINQSLLLKGR